MNGPIKWHGGKHYLANRIVALMPPHLHYVEPYAGGLAVLLAKDPEGVSEVVNDLDTDLTAFWACLIDPAAFQEFLRMCEATPVSHAVWLAAGEVDEDNLPMRAWGFFVRCRQSLAGRMLAFTPLSRRRTRRGMNEQASSWLSAVEGLPDVHARLRRVVVLNRRAVDVIRSEDGPDTLFYLDPPYLHATRHSPDVYACEMTEGDHAELLAVLSRVQGRFLLSGYPSGMYEDAARSCGWTLHTFDMPNHAASGTVKRRMTECVWTNFYQE